MESLRIRQKLRLNVAGATTTMTTITTSTVLLSSIAQTYEVNHQWLSSLKRMRKPSPPMREDTAPFAKKESPSGTTPKNPLKQGASILIACSSNE